MRCGRRLRLVLLLTVYIVTTGRTWAQVEPGITVESVAKYFEAEKAGLQAGDVLLSWSRGDAKGEIKSPFDLSAIEIEQAPRPRQCHLRRASRCREGDLGDGAG